MWVKICGIRDPETARAMAALGPDAVGLNFYRPSPRAVDVETAAVIVRELPAGVEPVGLFVNAAAAEIAAACRRAGLRTVQLHGDEPPTLLAELQALRPEVRILRAFRLGQPDLTAVADYLQTCGEAGIRVAGCLIDACAPGMYGGTGRMVPHDAFADGWPEAWPPLILAGGLTPENVAETVRAVRPWGVDVAGGVESAPGIKDPARVARFIAQAQAAAYSSPSRSAFLG